MDGKNYVQELIRFLVTLRYESIPSTVIEDTKKYVLDTIGASLAGSAAPGAAILLECLEAVRSGRATIIGRGTRALAEDAAMINSYFATCLEVDSGHRLGGVHSACVVVPTALALAEEKNATGKSFIKSVIAGTELYSRLGVTSAKAQYAKGISPTGSASALGAVAAGSTIFRLSEDGMLSAIGIASALTPLSPRLSIVSGGMTKGLTEGIGAHNGIVAARLAEKGFTGCKNVILGKGGYLEVTTDGKFKPQTLLSGLGLRYEISNMYYKVHASCSWTHSAVDAALALREEDPGFAKNVRSICVKTFDEAVRVVSNNDPRDDIEAKFSIPYTVAVALLYGRVGPEEFSPSHLSNPNIRSLTRQIWVADDPELRDAYPNKSRPAILEITTMGGSSLKKRVDFPKGFPENPLSYDEIKTKFRGLVRPIISRNKCEEIIQLIDTLETLDDMKILSVLLC